MRVCAFLLILSTAGLTSAAAQSLADVAKKESERRQTVKDTGKSYTNKDLKPVPAPQGSDAQPPADVGKPADDQGAGTAADTKTDKDKSSAAPTGAAAPTELKDEAYWSKRMAALREQLERDQTFMDALQNRVDALTSDFVNRDDPAQRGQIATDRQKALAELDRIKKVIEQDKRAIPELEDEARRAGVPAGWLR